MRSLCSDSIVGTFWTQICIVPGNVLLNYIAIGNYISHLLRAFGFPSDSRKIIFYKKIDGRDADWTIGAALYEVDTMPPSLEGSAHRSGCYCGHSDSMPSIGDSRWHFLGTPSLCLAMFYWQC